MLSLGGWWCDVHSTMSQGVGLISMLNPFCCIYNSRHPTLIVLAWVGRPEIIDFVDMCGPNVTEASTPAEAAKAADDY